MYIVKFSSSSCLDYDYFKKSVEENIKIIEEIYNIKLKSLRFEYLGDDFAKGLFSIIFYE